MKYRDIVIIKKILQYSNEINGTINRFELDFDKFNRDYVMKNAISMCVLQIGEFAGKLTGEFKITYDKMPWRDIISMRNRTVHAYENIDIEILWKIATGNIPELKEYCECILNDQVV